MIATGTAHSVRECLEVAFDQAGLEIDERVVIDESLVRPAEVDHLIGDPTKAREDLGWEPRTSFEQLIRLMVDADLELLSGASAADGPGAPRARDRADGPGRLVPGGAAAGGGVRGDGGGARGGPRRASLGAAEHLRGRGARRWRASCSTPRACARRCRRCARTSSTTWRRPRSCRPRGSARRRRCAAIASATAALLEAVRDGGPGDPRVRGRHSARCSARPGRAPSARRRPAGRRAPTRSPSSPRTSSWGRCAPTTGCTRARGSSTTTSPSAAPSSS